MKIKNFLADHKGLVLGLCLTAIVSVLAMALIYMKIVVDELPSNNWTLY